MIIALVIIVFTMILTAIGAVFFIIKMDKESKEGKY